MAIWGVYWWSSCLWWVIFFDPIIVLGISLSKVHSPYSTSTYAFLHTISNRGSIPTPAGGSYLHIRLLQTIPSTHTNGPHQDHGITMKTYHEQNFIRTKSSLPSPYSGKISCIWIHHLRHWIIIIVKSNLAHNQLCLSAVWRLGMYGYYPTDAWGKYFLCWERLVPVCYGPRKY